jgi:hypothetical protein
VGHVRIVLGWCLHVVEAQQLGKPIQHHGLDLTPGEDEFLREACIRLLKSQCQDDADVSDNRCNTHAMPSSRDLDTSTSCCARRPATITHCSSPLCGVAGEVIIARCY